MGKLNSRVSKLKPWHGLMIFAIVLVAMLFGFSLLQYYWGMTGLILTEVFLVVISIVGMLLFKGNWRDLFPLAKPQGRHIGGSIVLWIGAFFLSLAISAAQILLFPETMEVNQGLNDFFNSQNVFLAVILSPLLAGVCEEILHRGFMLSSFRRIKKTWVKVLIFGVLFGLFHLNPYRFLGTAFLGGVFTFVLLRTGNILIPMAIHFLQDFVAIGIVYLGRNTYTPEYYADFDPGVYKAALPVYIILGAIPFIIGILLLHKERELSPSERVMLGKPAAPTAPGASNAPSVSWQDTLSKELGVALIRQNRFAAIIGEAPSWQVDMDAGTISFDGREFPISLLGTESDSSKTWLWGWANAGNYAEVIYNDSELFYKHCEIQNITDLRGRALPLTELVNGHTIAAYAVVSRGSVGRLCYYKAPYDGGAAFLLVKDVPEEVFAPATALEAASAITEAIAALPVNHRLLVSGVCELLRDGEPLNVEFDDLGRIAKIETEVVGE